MHPLSSFFKTENKTLSEELSFSYFHHSNVINRDIHLVSNILLVCLYQNLLFNFFSNKVAIVFICFQIGMFILMNFFSGVTYLLVTLFWYYFINKQLTSCFIILVIIGTCLIAQLLGHYLIQGTIADFAVFEIIYSTPTMCMVFFIYEATNLQHDLVKKTIDDSNRYRIKKN